MRAFSAIATVTLFAGCAGDVPTSSPSLDERADPHPAAATAIQVLPEFAYIGTGETRQFSVSGEPGPYEWWIAAKVGRDLGTVDQTGFYQAPPTLLDGMRRFQVCARVTASPVLESCALVHLHHDLVIPTITSAGGHNQSAPAGTPVPVAPGVLVRHADGSPWSGVIVKFTVTRGGGRATPARIRTGPDGVARVTSWTLGRHPGRNVLEAVAFDSALAGQSVRFLARGL